MGYKLVVLAGPLAGQRFILPSVPTTIGADPLSHITWPDEQLAAHHAEIRWQEGRHILRDLGSASGTFVNGRRIAAPQPLRPGDEIWIGNCVFRYAATPTSAPTAIAPVRRPRRRATIVLAAAAAITVAVSALLIFQGIPQILNRLLPATPLASSPVQTPEVSWTITPTYTLAPSPASAETPGPRRYPPPELLAPAEGAAGVALTLQWSWQGILGPDEWYAVWVWKEEDAPQSLTWTRVPQCEVGPGLAPGTYNWQVVVVQGVVQGSWQRDLSPPSEIRRFKLVPLTATPTPSATSTPSATPSPSATPTATWTPEPSAYIIIHGQVYDGRQGPGAPLPDAEVKVYLDGQRHTVRSDPAGKYRVEVTLRLPDLRGEQARPEALPRVDLIASTPGYEPGMGQALLGAIAAGQTYTLSVDLALFPAATATPTWLPPTPSPSHTPARTPEA